jgi:LmbE family N-acetylglucosaminyl deacetylase
MSLENKRLLFSLAHPDDESFGFAGTLARYSKTGVEAHLICATNGDVGTIDEEYMEGFNSIAERRIYELECAAEVLGLTLHLFDYRDSGMAGTPDNDHPDSLVSQDMEEVVRRVTQVIREVRPHVVATFDPLGGYMHPDHIAIHKATVRAFEATGDETQFPEQLEAGLTPYQPQKLYHSTSDLRLMRLMVRVAPLLGIDPTRVGRNKDMDAKAIAEREVGPSHARIRTRKYRDVSQRAWDCHASQRFPAAGIVQWAIRRMLRGDDHYTRMYPPVNGAVREHDLFEGVVLEETGTD